MKERLVGIFFAYAVFHHMVSCWIGSVSSFDSLANVCHVSQVFTACHNTDERSTLLLSLNSLCC